ncbi:DUF2975 domain-containing protein [Metabacillus litoralis]|uniref:DUF2975 domain-containing protein n=1 Tax=Metabacillus litoralis TaxID=152268 RepID=A0A5C6VM79_9BACI|nr:DUF2975 domain-containing protein [Metabacillus litoralis]TXC86049.1 DUF2975 domain-containing protein [Metabacillus litoralis]
MKLQTTTLMKIVIYTIGLSILCLCSFWLPWQSRVLAEMYPEFAHLQYPLLIGIYLTALPFFFALYKILELLRYIDQNIAFSDSSVVALKYIKYCAIAISLLYVIGFIILNYNQAGNPGILLLGIIITFTSLVIAVFAALLQMLLKNALNVKSENDLTI